MDLLKAPFTIILFLLPVLLMAQEVNDPGTLDVRGESSLKVPPDEAVAQFRLEAKELDYAKAVKLIGQKTDNLVKSLVNIGFDEESFKTTGFNVSKNYVYQHNQRKDSGYVARQSIFLSFPYDREKIIKVINTVSASSSDPNLSFHFQLSEKRKKEVNDELISMAVKDARAKADIIVKAAKTEISGIKEIVYGPSFEPAPQLARMRETAAAGDESYGGFYVEDLSFNESIRIIYRLKSIE